MNDPSAALKQMVEEADLTGLELSRKSRVSYGKIKRWLNGTTVKLNLLDADSIHRTLTGRGLMPVPEKPLQPKAGRVNS